MLLSGESIHPIAHAAIAKFATAGGLLILVDRVIRHAAITQLWLLANSHRCVGASMWSALPKALAICRRARCMARVRVVRALIS